MTAVLLHVQFTCPLFAGRRRGLRRSEWCQEQDSVLFHCCSERSSASPWPPVHLTPVGFSFLFCKTRLFRPPNLKMTESPLYHMWTQQLLLLWHLYCPPLSPPTTYLRMRDRLQCPSVGKLSRQARRQWGVSVPAFTILSNNSVHLSFSPPDMGSSRQRQCLVHPQCQEHNIV